MNEYCTGLSVSRFVQWLFCIVSDGIYTVLLEDIYSNYCIQECILKKTWKVLGQAIDDAMYLLYRSNAARLCKRDLGS